MKKGVIFFVGLSLIGCGLGAELLFGGKVDTEGNYRHFAGVNLICFVSQDSLTLWSEIEQFIQNEPVLKTYYAILPYTSYHMTIHPLFTEHETRLEGGMTFKTMLERNKKSFVSLYDFINLQPLLAPSATIEKVFAGRNLGIALNMFGQDSEKALEIRKIVETTTRLADYPNYKYHLTFGYKFKEPSSRQEIQDVKMAAAKLEAFILQKLRGSVIKFGPVKLCEFDDMTAFNPTNPHNWGSTKQEL